MGSLWVKKNKVDQVRLPEKYSIGADGPDDPVFQMTSVGVSFEFYMQSILKTAG